MSVNFSSLSTITVGDNYHSKIEAYNEKYFSTTTSEQKKLLFIEQLKIMLSHHKITKKKKKNNHTRLLTHYGELQNTNKNIIGTGASATVVFIKSKKTTKIYAVKIFNSKKKQSFNMKKLISEFCISSTLDHPNIVKTIDLVLDEKKRYCTVMEYCSGGDLYSFIKEGRLTLHDEINGYFKQLLDGLSYLHSLGVAHRDIKPENLLLVKQSNNVMILKITDFGEADVFREVWQSTTRLSDGLCGSTPYIAPEIFTHSRLGYNASQADVWSAGIVYFCMLLNGVPFFSAQPSDTNYCLYKSKYTTQDYTAFYSFDEETRHVLYNMLNPDPNSRFTIQQILDLSCLSEIKPPVLIDIL